MRFFLILPDKIGNRKFLKIKRTWQLWIVNNEFWPDLANPFSFEDGQESSKMLQIERVSRRGINLIVCVVGL